MHPYTPPFYLFIIYHITGVLKVVTSHWQELSLFLQKYQQPLLLFCFSSSFSSSVGWCFEVGLQ